jgi:alpha-L-fucosidase
MTKPVFVDRRLQALTGKPWRKIHLDFHNSQHVKSVGEAFDPEEFVSTLRRGHVNAVVVFAKDMHGYFYYPSAYGPVHPGLHRDLLGEQVAACREAGITVSAYYCVTWDNYLAERHPEWLVFKRDRTTYLPKFDEVPRWTALCLAHEDFVALVLDHSKELLTRYDLDGIWYDMPLPIDGECFCARCLELIRANGEDPFDVAVQRAHKQRLLTEFLQRSHELAHEIRPDIQVDQNNQTRFGLGERAPYLDNIDIEALPTGGWGYFYYPVDVRYARNFGTTVYGQTGRFHRSWGDFGGLKHPHQLRVELASIVAQGARCCVGDQAPPSGKLDAAVYDTIGQAYAQIEALEPYLDGAAPAVEAAVVVDGLPLTDPGAGSRSGGEPGLDSVVGWVKVLSELHVQVDVVEPNVDFDRYRMLVVPESLRVGPDLAERLIAFVRGGGSLLASHDALRVTGGGTQPLLDALGLEDEGESPFTPAYLVPEAGCLDTLASFEYALYEGAARWSVREDATHVLARLGEPAFQRGPDHYTSHAQTPVDHVTDHAVVIQRGRFGAVAFPLGTSYFRHGYWVYREVVRHLVDAVLPERLVRTSAPISADVAVTHQAKTAERPERWLVHVVNYSANRRAPDHVENYEDPVPLTDVVIELGVDADVDRAYLAPRSPEVAPTTLAVERQSDCWRVCVPRVETSAIVVLECQVPASPEVAPVTSQAVSATPAPGTSSAGSVASG